MKPYFKLFLTLLLLLVTCSSCGTTTSKIPFELTTQPTSINQVNPSYTQTLTTETNKQNTPTQNTLAPVITPTAKQSCIRLNAVDPPPESIKTGMVLLYDRQDGTVFSEDLVSDEKSVISGAQWNMIFASPDKKGFAYLVPNDEMDFQLAYALSTIQGIKTITLDKRVFGEWPLLSGWVNNDTVAFQVFGHQPTSLILIDLASGQRRELLPNFPDINGLDAWSWSNWGRTLFSPNLQYVVYPRLKSQEPHRYILWDMQEQKVVNFIDAGHASFAPQWSPDGKKFAVVVNDLVMMDVDGTMTQLTSLQTLFPSYNPKIRLWNWSPDSQRIAFWLDLYSGTIFVEERLMVLNTITSELTDFCRFGDQVQISTGTLEYAPSPVWSPDGSAVIIENRETEDKSQLILVDLDHHIAAKIGENFYPYDWVLK